MSRGPSFQAQTERCIILKLLDNYLRNRKQRVVLNGSIADYSLVSSGAPQGSVLGPLLFLIYINDLENNIKSNVQFFAGDTMLFSIVKDHFCWWIKLWPSNYKWMGSPMEIGIKIWSKKMNFGPKNCNAGHFGPFWAPPGVSKTTGHPIVSVKSEFLRFTK